MAGITASGIGGSGLDVNGLVSQLVAAERAPLQQRISRAEADINTKLSAIGTIRSSLAVMQSTLAAIKTPESLQLRRATSSDISVFRPTASSAAVPASYSVEVSKLAAANKRSSAEQSNGASLGSGKLSLTQNSTTLTIDITPEMSLAALRDAINSAPGNNGIQAALLNTSGGTRLTLTATRTGTDHAISLGTQGADSILDAFVAGFGDTVPAANAEVEIDGYPVVSQTNTISGVIDGVTLDLLSAKPGSTLALTITNDSSAVRDKINKFVTDFNAFQTQAARLRAYDPKTRVGGPLLGDSALRTIEGVVRRELIGATVSAPAATNSLSAIGIRFGADGKLAINESQLAEALGNRMNEVATMFTANDGLVARLNTVIDAQISAEGALTARTNGLDARKRNVEKDKESMEARLALVEKRYRAQFINLDRMLADMQGMGSYIAKIGASK